MHICNEVWDLHEYEEMIKETSRWCGGWTASTLTLQIKARCSPVLVECIVIVLGVCGLM